ncbi:MAG: lamin tail domain-containing protein, partial [Planctomycetales bacterium]|nr:lamin tail domain-containing protein [Planctomycetales bacterium]
GTIYYTLDGSDPRLIGGDLSPTAIEYNGPVTLDMWTTVKTRVWSGGAWSALAEAVFQTPGPPGLRINEIAADNEEGLLDADGDDSDWIEIYNPTSVSVDLAGWSLTDNAGNLDKWQFPAITLPGDSYLVVFASNKDRLDPNELHTNFELDAAGEFLALVAPDETTIVSQFDPFPRQAPDVSYGQAMRIEESEVLSQGATIRAFVPTDDTLGLDWTLVDFDDSSWSEGATGVGFDTGGAYDGLIGLDLEAAMHGQNATAYVRAPFSVDNPAAVDLLHLDVQYDDGLIAYLNGRPVARRNAPDEAESSVLAHWSFDEAFGTSVADDSGNARHATLEGAGGALAAPGVFGANGDPGAGGLLLTDGSDYVAVPRLEMRTSDFTISAWINPESIEDGDEIFGDWSDPWQFRLFLNADNSLSLALRRDGPDSNNGDLVALSTPADAITPGVYQHVAATWNRDTHTSQLYVDGQLAAATTLTRQNVDLRNNSHTQYQIGWKRDDAGGKYDGLLDELWVFREALSAEQIAHLISENAYLPGVRPPQFVDLADFVGGGDGSLPGTGTATGINPVSGAVNQSVVGGNYAQTGAEGTYVFVDTPGYESIEGTFLPNGTIGPQVIDGAGHTFDFAGVSDASPAYSVWGNGLIGVDPSGTDGQPNFTGDPIAHSMLTAHAQKGITFDLDIVRQTQEDAILDRFTTYAGNSSPQGSIHYYVLIDGVVVASNSFVGAGYDLLDIPIDPADRYLTLVTTNSAINVNSADHAYFGDPFLRLNFDHLPPQSDWNAAAATDRDDEAALTPETIDLSAHRDLLVAGTNVLAIQVLNSSASNNDLLLVPRVTTGEAFAVSGEFRYFSTPTPGGPNISALDSPPPSISEVVHSPQTPAGGEPTVIEAAVADSDGLASVLLRYQLVLPGAYIPAQLALSPAELMADPTAPRPANPAFEDPNNWTTLVMLDDGTGGDRVAGDGVFSASVPGQAHRTLVRYRITAMDTTGSSIRAPLVEDPSLNFAYFVYDGVPDYVADQATVSAGGLPNVHAADALTTLPVYTLITDANELADAFGYDPADRIPKSNEAARDAFNWEGAFVYDGIVYDHIGYRLRQANDRYGGTGKRSMRIRFNQGHYLQARDANGELYPTNWRTLNISKMSDNKRVGNFGLVETVNQILWNVMGVPTPVTHHFHFRVVDAAEELDQYFGDFWGIGLAVQDYDSRFLEHYNLEDGNLYKLKDGVFDGAELKRNQGLDAVRDDSDFQNIRANLRPEQTDAWLDEHVNYEAWYRYHAVVEAVRHYDFRAADSHSKNRAWYFEPSDINPLGELWTLPHDHDASWGPSFNSGEDYSKNAIFGGEGKPEFQQQYRNTLREFRDLVWTEEVIYPLLDRIAAQIENLVLADRDRWTGAPAAAGFEDYGDLASKVADMKNFAFVGWTGSTGPTVPDGGRAAYLDTLANAGDDATSIPETPSASYTGPAGFPRNQLTFQTSAFADPQGTDTFAAIQWRIAEVGGERFEYDAAWESGELAEFDPDIRIPADVVEPGRTYRVRVQMIDRTQRTSHWSAPIEFTVGEAMPTALSESLRISEINYHPHDPTAAELAAGFSDAESFEFIEFTNTGSTVIDLSGLQLVDGVGFVFPPTMLEPGSHIVVVHDEAAFVARYGLDATVVGAWDTTTSGGVLSNGGEQILLHDALGATILDFTFDDANGWPMRADGDGSTLEPIDLQGDYTSADNWRASGEYGGSPGALGVGPRSDIVINELLAHTDPPQFDAVELFNATDAAIDISGWYLTDSVNQLRAYRIPDGTTIAAGAYRVFDQRDFRTAGVDLAFSAADGDRALLLETSDDDRLLSFVDDIAFAASLNGESFGRVRDSQGNVHFVPQQSLSLGSENVGPRIGPIVISELQYAPADPDGPGGAEPAQLEFIEIYNPTDLDVPLAEWQIQEAVSFAFASTSVLAAGETLLVVPFDPLVDAALAAQFRAHYALSDQVAMVGPYLGALNNAGELVRLSRADDPPLHEPGFFPRLIEDELRYDDEAPWPVEADAGGLSLQRVASRLWGADVASWQAAVPTPGEYVDTGATLRVVSMQASPSGVTVLLARGIQTTLLNLYDGIDTAIDLPDVMLVGDAVGPVRGNLSWDDATNQLHFTASGGILPADNYTLTLSSRSDGFAGTDGKLLDGDGDGAFGGDYVARLLVNQTPDAVVSIRDFARGPGQAVAIDGTDGLPISISEAAGITELGFTLLFDPNLLDVTGASPAADLPGAWTVDQFDVLGPGRLRISASGTAPLGAGATQVLVLAASVPQDATIGLNNLLRIDQLAANSETIEVIADNAIHVVAYPGDTTGVDRYSALDASLIARVVVGLDGGFDAFGASDPMIVADVTGNGSLSALDASFVARKAVGLSQPEIPDPPAPLPPPSDTWSSASGVNAFLLPTMADISAPDIERAAHGSRLAARRDVVLRRNVEIVYADLILQDDLLTPEVASSAAP